MRGHDTQQAGMFSYLSPEERVPETHLLRPIRQYVDTALTALSPQLATLYAHTGRPSIAPEKLQRALLLQVLYSLRSERPLTEELQYNMLFRWFVGLDLAGCGNTLWTCRNFIVQHVWNNRGTSRRMLKKAVQQGRSERRGEAYISVR